MATSQNGTARKILLARDVAPAIRQRDRKPRLGARTSSSGRRYSSPKNHALC